MSGAETVELKPCPFCRGKASVHQWDDNFGIVLEGQEPLPTSYHIACDDCDAGHPPSYNRDEAIAAWDTRVTQADALAVIQEYEALMERGFADRREVERVRNLGRAYLVREGGAAKPEGGET
jgi:hypothetical protein